ncbi:MAG: aminoacyl--tRNA ligase-related protein [Planctomycetota bacterium]
MAIVRRHMDPIAAEVLLPSLQPIDLWEKTQRRAAYGDNLFVVTDRHGRESALGPTHEEVITHLVGAFVKSYRDLPKSLYQIQTKFRDEFRPRFGLLRTREFQMKDAYSFHLPAPGSGNEHAVAEQSEAAGQGPAGDATTLGTLSHTYEQFRAAYHAIFQDCGLPVMEVEAEAGPIGGDASHEFMCPAPTGEDTILVSDKHNYAANVEKCSTGYRDHAADFDSYVKRDAKRPDIAEAEDKGWKPIDLELVETPNVKSIEDLCRFWKSNQGGKLHPKNILKTIICQTNGGWIIAVVRGDHELNLAKLSNAIADSVVLADEGEAKKAGFPVGYVGPQSVVGRNNAKIIVDPDAMQGGFWVAGGGKEGTHCKGFYWLRDLILFDVVSDKKKLEASMAGKRGALSDDNFDLASENRIVVADIRNAVAGDPSPLNDGGVLEERKGIELGHIFKLGDKYTRGLNVTVAGEDNQPVHPLMGCYGIGVNRILAAAIECEAGHDESGIVWPVALAPYHVVITPIKYDGAVKETVDRLAEELEAVAISGVQLLGAQLPGVQLPGVEVLIDDRDERPGPKFKDADLIGIPVRITVGDKGLGADEPFVEVKARDGRNGDKGEQVALDGAVARVVELLGEMTSHARQ